MGGSARSLPPAPRSTVNDYDQKIARIERTFVRFLFRPAGSRGRPRASPPARTIHGRDAGIVGINPFALRYSGKVATDGNRAALSYLWVLPILRQVAAS
jgi:hypothetical protein